MTETVMSYKRRKKGGKRKTVEVKEYDRKLREGESMGKDTEKSGITLKICNNGELEQVLYMRQSPYDLLILQTTKAYYKIQETNIRNVLIHKIRSV